MDYGVHLPLIAFNDQRWSLDCLLTYVRTTERLGFQMLAANTWSSRAPGLTG
jgi:hypothetical protein